MITDFAVGKADGAGGFATFTRGAFQTNRSGRMRTSRTDVLLCGRAIVVLIALSLPMASQTQTIGVTVNAAFPPVSYLPYPGTQYSADFLKYVASSPLVDGINPPLLWSMVDNGPGSLGKQYDWSVFDAVIQPYIDLGKTVNLIVWPISEAGINNQNHSNHATPAYVMNLVDAVTCPEFPGDGTRTGSYPVVWETGFKYHYKKFITEVLKHYAGNPRIGYVRFGLTGGAAIYPRCPSEQTPYLPPGRSFKQVILEFDKEMLSYEKSQNPTFPVIAPMAAYQNQTVYADTEAAHGIANGFGLGTQGLQTSDITSYPLCQGDWCNLFAKYSSVQPTPIFELQPYGQSDPSATCTPSCWDVNQQQTGPLPPLLSFAVEHHANTFEIYSPDLLVALDPNYPGYKEYHTEYENALSAVHSGSGSSLTISPTSLKFGRFLVGTSSAAQTITLTNSGPSVLTVRRVTALGDYSEINDCVAESLAPAQQCTISVVFTPSARGKRGGLLRITDTDLWSPQAIGLTGTGH
jgi:Abnormal spindle-like microcephaly-assoc'd, ASPM-SPD-2-Hydin